jgi:death-on-curing protein
MSEKINYPDVSDVLMIHTEMIIRFGGRDGVRDYFLLDSALERPKATFGGDDLYPGIFEKSAALIQSLILNHPFDDGNKRTALATCALLLHLNGADMRLPVTESIEFTLAIDNHSLSLEQIASWLEIHVQKEKKK